MKNILIVWSFLVLTACGPTKMVETNPENITPAPSASTSEPSGPEGVKAEMPPKESATGINVFTSKAEVKAIMDYLASDELKGRDSGSEGIEMAAEYIEKHFAENAVLPYYKTYRDTLSNYKEPSFNVVGVVEGNDPRLKNEFIVIGAHYDHIGTIEPENGDNIANGANDNASGTTAVMEMARYFGKNKSNKRTLIFALFSAEEKGLLGSKHLAKRMKSEELNLYAMLNFEMIGVPMRNKDYEVYITGYEKSNLAEVSNKYAEENLIGFLPTAKDYGLFQRSDNYDFYKEFGVPAHTYCTFDFTNFAYYHKVGDELSEMDFAHMARIINKMIPVVKGIANAPTQEIKMK